jgi:hypothetical protein
MHDVCCFYSYADDDAGDDAGDDGSGMSGDIAVEHKAIQKCRSTATPTNIESRL